MISENWSCMNIAEIYEDILKKNCSSGIVQHNANCIRLSSIIRMAITFQVHVCSRLPHQTQTKLHVSVYTWFYPPSSRKLQHRHHSSRDYSSPITGCRYFQHKIAYNPHWSGDVSKLQSLKTISFIPNQQFPNPWHKRIKYILSPIIMVSWKMAPLETSQSSSRPPFSTKPMDYQKGYSSQFWETESWNQFPFTVPHLSYLPYPTWHIVPTASLITFTLVPIFS